MDLLLKVLEIILAALYLGSAVVYVWDFVRSTEFSAKLCGILIRLGVACHIIYFILLGIAFGRNPISNFNEFFSALALGLAVIYLYLEMRFKSRSLGPWIIAITAAAQVVSTVLAKHSVVEEGSPILSIWYTFHQVFMPLAFASLLISAVFSLMYLVLYRSLKRKMFGFFFDRFLPLATLGEMNYQALLTGVIFCLLNLPFAFVMVYLFNDGKWDLHYCMFFTYLVVYTIGVLLGKFAGWRGNRLAIYSLAALLVLIIATGVGKLLSETHAWF